MMTEVTRDVSNLSSNHLIIRSLDRLENPNITFSNIRSKFIILNIDDYARFARDYQISLTHESKNTYTNSNGSARAFELEFTHARTCAGMEDSRAHD